MDHAIDERPVVGTLYVARPLELPPMTAVAAFDAHRDAASIADTDERGEAETHGARLRLTGSCAPERSRSYTALRRTSGRLFHRRTLVSFPVEIEVSPWSGTRCEIGIRPRGRTVPTTDGWLQRRYIALAVDAAELLAHALERQVEDWMRGQLRDPDSPVTLASA
jgi:hypothetical protein